ncbi:hypothetical protein [Trueperella bialowiezensis]|uniref:Uncharacterized protein n=1 Tax=Trueperella bialowiezensis TaxID=312285 RepID=A0A448PDW1_9ACTO|nr:hypothetical protein [Trueperella bialowiezensis]VEI13111.1 Uncharacterised protein [Trueperella bialowiezensis]
MQLINTLASFLTATSLAIASSVPMSDSSPPEFNDRAIASNSAITLNQAHLSNSPITKHLQEREAPDGLFKTQGEITPNWMKPTTEGGGRIIKNYPRVSKSAACNKIKAGEMIFTIAWNGLVCMPLGFINPGISYVCGLAGSLGTTYLVDDSSCRR